MFSLPRPASSHATTSAPLLLTLAFADLKCAPEVAAPEIATAASAISAARAAHAVRMRRIAPPPCRCGIQCRSAQVRHPCSDSVRVAVLPPNHGLNSPELSESRKFDGTLWRLGAERHIKGVRSAAGGIRPQTMSGDPLLPALLGAAAFALGWFAHGSPRQNRKRRRD